MNSSIRVVLADDHEVFVEGLRMVLAAEDDLEIVATAGDGASALRAAEDHRPDVLVLDVHMPATDIQQVIVAARQRVPGARLLALSDGHLVLSDQSHMKCLFVGAGGTGETGK